MAALRGLWALTWLETKIFVREPLGVIGTVGFPILLFVLLQRIGTSDSGRARVPRLLSSDLPVLAATMMALSACISLVAIIAIYREGGILKRLRATPLRPATILMAHVLVKLGFTALTLVLLVLVGGAPSLPTHDVPWFSFGAAVLYTTLCLLAVGFVLASVVPTARFAQPLATLVVYTMLGLSGLVIPLAAMPPAARGVARALPLTYAVSLLRGTWRGEGWLAHGPDVAMLAVMFIALTVVATWVFRWE